ncbi:MAG: fatty acid--CoA ligase, partial [Chloroflexi bacterium]|nr:fatty acid--CoA ligase [Chloroflexota bacterium]
MATDLIERTPQAHDYPLLIRHLLHTACAYAQDQEIVYRDLKRHTYGDFRRRVGRL